MLNSYFWQKRAKIPNNPISPLIFDTSISIRGLYLTLRDLGLSKIDLTPKIGLEWYCFSLNENRTQGVHFFYTYLTILKSWLKPPILYKSLINSIYYPVNSKIWVLADPQIRVLVVTRLQNGAIGVFSRELLVC